MKKFFLTLAAVLGFASQAGSKTQITLDQLTAPTTTAVMVSVPGKGWAPAQLDPSLVLDTATAPPTLKAPGGGSGTTPTFVDLVALAGNVDGVNAFFTLPSIPNPATSLEVVVNGLIYKPGVDFTLATGGSTITFTATSIPQVGSILMASYRR